MNLNVTAFLVARIRTYPLAGFLPLRSRFFFTQNLPKPKIKGITPGVVAQSKSRLLFFLMQSPT
jgi:hypothetical protein